MTQERHHRPQTMDNRTEDRRIGPWSDPLPAVRRRTAVADQESQSRMAHI